MELQRTKSNALIALQKSIKQSYSQPKEMKWVQSPAFAAGSYQNWRKSNLKRKKILSNIKE